MDAPKSPSLDTYDRIFKDESLSLSTGRCYSEESCPCSDQSFCDYGYDCKGIHSYVPSIDDEYDGPPRWKCPPLSPHSIAWYKKEAEEKAIAAARAAKTPSPTPSPAKTPSLTPSPLKTTWTSSPKASISGGLVAPDTDDSDDGGDDGPYNDLEVPDSDPTSESSNC